MARGCAALALCDGASAARLLLLVLIAAALARLDRQQDAEPRYRGDIGEM